MRLIGAAEVPPPEVVGEVFGREVNTHTMIGLGLIACTLFVIWLLRRNA